MTMRMSRVAQEQTPTWMLPAICLLLSYKGKLSVWFGCCSSSSNGIRTPPAQHSKPCNCLEQTAGLYGMLNPVYAQGPNSWTEVWFHLMHTWSRWQNCNIVVGSNPICHKNTAELHTRLRSASAWRNTHDAVEMSQSGHLPSSMWCCFCPLHTYNI